ncbi:MAG: hypothetical protein U9P36_10070, partial [Thermodesulfobacteriota bacterium]|nr:hypothetical protein [Thermodesulfobacteriota bacterium]
MKAERRLFRNGTAAFLISGSGCRLLARIFHEHFAHFKVTSVNHMIKLRIIPYFKFAKCSPKASRCD